MPRRIPAHREAWRSTMSDDGADNDGIPQPGEFDATPVVTNEDDVSTESDLVGDQVPENVTTRRSSGMAGPTSDSSRSVISSLPQSRGPTEEPDPLELRFSKLIKDIETFFGPDPLGEPFSKEFSRTCAEPIPRAPPCDELFTFMALEASEVTDNDFRTVEYVLKNRKAEYEEICSALKKAAEKEEIKSRRSSVGAIDKPIQMDFKEQKDCPLTEPENKTLNEMTSGNDLSDSQFRAIVTFLQSPSQSKFNAIFETFTSKHGTVDVKQICGHLDCLYSGTDAPDMGAEPNSEDLSAELPSKYISMSTKSSVNTKTTTSMPQGQRWSHLACDPAILTQEMKAIENFIRLHHLDGRSIDEDGYTVMKPPKSRKFLFALVARARLNLWLAKHLLKRFQDLMAAMGTSELEETQCNNLKLHYDAYFRSNPLEYKELPHHEKVTVKSLVANALLSDLSIGVNLIIDLANIFNQADIRENLSRFGLYMSNLVLKQSDIIQQKFIQSEKERQEVRELPWQLVSSTTAEVLGIHLNPDTGVPIVLESANPAMYFTLLQAYNYRGPNNGIGGIATARKALEQSIIKICGSIRNSRDPLSNVPMDKIKLVFEDFIQAPSAHGLAIDPSNTGSSIRNGTGFVGTAPAESVVGFVGSAPSSHQARRSSGGGGGNARSRERGRSALKSTGDTKREQSIARKLEPKNKASMDQYCVTRKALGENLEHVESVAQSLVHDCSDLDDKYLKKFLIGCFKLKGKKVEIPLRPSFSNPVEFWSWDRAPAGVKPPSNLYVRYCVLADVFRLFKNNQLSAYGEAYRRVHDPSWEATTQEYASKYPAYNFNGADNKVAVGTNQDGAGGGGGGRGGGRKGFRKN